MHDVELAVPLTQLKAKPFPCSGIRLAQLKDTIQDLLDTGIPLTLSIIYLEIAKQIDFPAPVSPVSTFNPFPKVNSKRSIRVKFSICRQDNIYQ